MKLAGVRKLPAFGVTCCSGWAIASHRTSRYLKRLNTSKESDCPWQDRVTGTSFIALFLRLG